jgi:hypothetical protein
MTISRGITLKGVGLADLWPQVGMLVIYIRSMPLSCFRLEGCVISPLD